MRAPPTPHTRRHFLRSSAGALFAVSALPLLNACASPSTAPTSAGAPAAPATTAAPVVAPTASVLPVKLGVVGDGSGFGPLEGGKALGAWQAGGVDLEVIGHRGGAEAATGLVGGGIDIFQGEVTHAFRLLGQGQALRVIGAATGRHAYVLAGAPGASPSIEGLRGKKIGITSPGSQTDNSMRYLLRTNGIEADKDVELVALGNGAPMVAGVKAGQVYAGNLNANHIIQLGLTDWVTIYDFGEQFAPFEGTDFIVRQDWLQKNGDAAKRFLKAHLAIINQLAADDTAALRVHAQTNPEIDQSLAPALIAITRKSWVLDGKPTREGLQKVIDVEAVGTGKQQTTLPDFATFVDLAYLPS